MTTKQGALVIFILVFILYAATLMPTVDFADSGDFATAAYVWGIPHPPGFPLLTILGKLIMLTAPIGTMAWRMGLVSSAAGALACMMVFLTAAALTKNRLAATIAAAAFAVSGWLWSQSTIIEAYSLNVFFFLLMQYLYVRWIQEDKINYFYWACATAGLSLTNHLSIIFYGVIPLAIFLSINAFKRKLAIKQIFTGIACFMAPLSIYAYLPIAASFDPIKNWGNPSTLANFINHVSMRQYEGFVTFPPAHLYPSIIWQLLKVIVQEFWVLAIPGFYGFLLIPSNIRMQFTAMLILSMLFAMTSARLHTENFQHYIPLFSDISIMIGLSLAALIAWSAKGNHRNYMILLACMLISIGANTLVSFKRAAIIRDAPAFEFAKRILTGLPKDAVLFATSDFVNLPLEYAQYVGGIREDVTIASWKMLKNDTELSLLRRNGLKGIEPDELDKSKTTYKNILSTLLRKNPQRDFFVSSYQDYGKNIYLDYSEPLLVLSSKNAAEQKGPTRISRWPNRDDLECKNYRRSENLAIDNLVAFLFSKGRYSEAKKFAGRALIIDSKNSYLWLTKAKIAANDQEYETARKFALKAIDANPVSSVNYSETGAILFRQGKYAEAIKYYERALDYSQPSEKNNIINEHYALASLYLRIKDFSKANNHLEAILDYDLTPKDRAAVEQLLVRARAGK